MSSANREAILIGVASILMMLTVFAKPLAIPEEWQAAPILIAAVLFLVVFYFKRKAKAEPVAQPPPVAPLAKRKRAFWMVASALISGSVIMLPLLPYTVENFHFWIYYYVVPFQIVFMTIFLVFFWRKIVSPGPKKSQDE